MPGTLLHTGASVSCPHGATAQTTTSNTKVFVGGAPVATLTDTTTVAGCPFQVPVGAGTKPQPCVRVQWQAPATRVLVDGRPALLNTSTGLCQSAEQIPQGPPVIASTQTTVTGQ
ncbi:PAAR-like protein [Streptomyces triculaminicus]|uniref:PAAR-like protein n=1 Tax=Streptomyces triculaminicus TaxID=2816232 RepID=UPI00378E7505